MQKALIIVAHGSRMESANNGTIAFIEGVSSKLTNYSEVVTAFLEFRKPDLKTSIDALVYKGIKEIVIFPFFLSGGSHLNDIEKSISDAQEFHISVKFLITARLGVLSELEDFVGKYLNELS